MSQNVVDWDDHSKRIRGEALLAASALLLFATLLIKPIPAFVYVLFPLGLAVGAYLVGIS
ncbi:hypothetical protein [Haloarcula nitratireducens]|uniref:Uncharacterized protein n=1 Tax=Haloarcula nitratireducens TaxID=2487749 RepID=A0AAW4PGL6_9EURY|nr:hypothetical protein [Halomicroarcula nitratireducens]MBX0296733.1 hypothetical protein [Halomicroarcula nitratireducens]